MNKIERLGHDKNVIKEVGRHGLNLGRSLRVTIGFIEIGRWSKVVEK